MRPPITITNKMFNLSIEITSLIGRYEGLLLPVPQPELRKHTKVQTIQSSLAIEGNTLTVDQVTDIINDKRVIGPKKDIEEVKNAIDVYDNLDRYQYDQQESFLKAHADLMKNIIPQAGKLRRKDVGVVSGSNVVHVAPPHNQIPKLIGDLFNFMKKEKELNPLIKSCVFHYELEFIHPFVDGNGRIGRLWQSVILYNYQPVFEYIPIESVIRENQSEYYKALKISDREGESTAFVEFMLEIIQEATKEFTKRIKPKRVSSAARLELAKEKFGIKEFQRKDYLKLNPKLNLIAASRDLAFGVEKHTLSKSGDKATTRYKFVVV